MLSKKKRSEENNILEKDKRAGKISRGTETRIKGIIMKREEEQRQCLKGH